MLCALLRGMEPFGASGCQCTGCSVVIPSHGLASIRRTNGPMTEKRVLLASMISFLFLIVYAQAVSRRPVAPERSRQTLQAANQQEHVEAVLNETQTSPVPRMEPEGTTVIESKTLRLELGKSSAAIRQVILKEFLDDSKGHPVSFSGDAPILSIRVGEVPIVWSLSEATPSKAIFRGADTVGNNYYISYAVDMNNSLVNIKLAQLEARKDPHSAEMSVVSSWTTGKEAANGYNRLELIVLESVTSGKDHYKRYPRLFGGNEIVPRGTMASLTGQYFCQSIRVQEPAKVAFIPLHHGAIAASATAALTQKEGLVGEGPSGTLTVYFGPRDYFYLKKIGFENAFPIGIIGQIGLILIVLLKGLAGATHNYGIAVILLSCLVTCCTAPFTLISMKSMRKMQELKPTVDKLMAQHKDDPKKMNQELMALYRAHRVSPLSGCLPMLLQMPILIALYRGISHVIELRGASFLWISDLSMPDRVWQLPFSLPVLGKDLNVLPIVMALTMSIQTKLSQGNTARSDNPTTQMMTGPMMPILFGIGFYRFPSGLVLYWLTNSLMSVGFYRFAMGSKK